MNDSIRQEERPADHLKVAYTEELLSLARGIVELGDRLFALPTPKQTDADDLALAGGPEFIHLAVLMLSYGAAAKKFFDSHPNKKKGESNKQFSLRQERSAGLNRKLAALDLRAIRSCSARNSLEHSDEHLDEAIILCSSGRYRLLCYNVAMGDFSMLGADVLPLRVYSHMTKVFHHFSATADLGRLHEEAKEIIKALDPRGIRKTYRLVGLGLR